MRMRVIVLAFSYAMSSLTLTAAITLSSPPQAEEQRAADARPSSADAEVKGMTTPKKITIDPEVEPFESCL